MTFRRLHHFVFRQQGKGKLTRIDGRCWTSGGLFHVALFQGQSCSTIDYVVDEKGTFTVGWIAREGDDVLTVGKFQHTNPVCCVNEFLSTLPAGAAKEVRPFFQDWLR